MDCWLYRWSFRERKTNLSSKRSLFILFWEFERQIYGVWWKLHARLSKLHSTCTKEKFEKKFVLGKKVYCFYHFRILIKICSEFFQKNFGTLVKFPFHVKRWSFQERTNLSNKAELLHFFENSSVKFTEFGDNFMHGCQDCILHVQTNNSRNFWCLGKKFTVFITFEF